MIQSERDQKILSRLSEQDIVSVKQLYALLSEVSTVTVRRDIIRLAEQGKLQRIRGGIKRIDSSAEAATATDALGNEVASRIAARLDLPEGEDVQSLQQADVVILPPVDTKISDTIYKRVKKAGVFCLDESSLEGEGLYLGVDNKQVGKDLGYRAARDFRQHEGDLSCLVVGHDSLANTRNRASGFLQGLRESFPGEVKAVNVDAAGVYIEAFRQTRDALEAFPEIALIFAINDQSVLAAIDAARSLQRTDIAAYCVGGEGGRIFDELDRNEILRGFGAMFPHVVARNAINAICRFYAGESQAEPVITPHRLLSPSNLSEYYTRVGGEWQLKAQIVEELAAPLTRPAGNSETHSVLFIQHYPSHHWYRTLSAELRRYCEELGFEYHTASMNSQVQEELRQTHREIAARASELVRSGDTIVISGGDCSRYLAEALCNRKLSALTVLTNSIPILEALAAAPHVRVMLTGGVYREPQRDLVGSSVSATLENIRITQAFLSVDGLSIDFGASSSDERAAKVLEHFAEHSRETIVLADHSRIDEDANFRAAALGKIDTIVTDYGASPRQRMAYASEGVGVLVAGDTSATAAGSYTPGQTIRKEK